MPPNLNEELKVEVVKRIKRSATFQKVFRGADGDFVLGEMKKQVKGFDPDPYINAYNCGMRDFYRFITNVLEADVEKAREALGAKAEER